MEASKKTLLILWHSRTGAAKQAAKAAYQAALDCQKELEQNHQILIHPVAEVTTEQMLTASSYLFCCPENLAAMTGEMKAFFDQQYYALLEKIEGRPYSMIISAGSDGQNALKQMERICTGWRLNLQVEPIILNTQSQTPEEIWAPKTLNSNQLEQAQEIGATLSAWL